MRSLALAALAAIFVSSAASAAPSSAGRTEFEVFRNGEPFGRHVITVMAAGDNLRAQSSVQLSAGMGPLVMFRLEQTCSETWSNGALARLTCSTLKDGRRTRVRAERRGGQLRVVGASGERLVSGQALPASWWSKPPEGATLINTETGEPMRAHVTNMGRETIAVAGRRIEADRVHVQGSVTGDLWYDASGRWVACRFSARGQNIEYRLATPLANAPA